ncbi:MAG: polysaccharide deacetylase family protein [Chitinophagaceae bacterium]|nr:MAG: polysaccharide deacetylase family protein [Chitinophagaceae bacterium]
MNNFSKILVFFCHLFFLQGYSQHQQKQYRLSHGAIVKGDTTKKELALVFTADEYGEGLQTIFQTLSNAKIKGSFFFTGRFYSNQFFQPIIKKLNNEGHYLGPHSDQHLLYCDWTKRDSLLVTKDSFSKDLQQNIAAMKALGIQRPTYFIPPYEWWNDSIACWSKEENLALFNFSPGIRTAADYTWVLLRSFFR